MPAFPHVSSQCHRLRESFPKHPLLSLSHLSTQASIFFIDLHTDLISLEIRSHAKPYHLVPSWILRFPICEALTIGMRMKRDKYVPPGGPIEQCLPTGAPTSTSTRAESLSSVIAEQLHHVLEPRSIQINRGRDPGSSHSEGSAGRQEWKPRAGPLSRDYSQPCVARGCSPLWSGSSFIKQMAPRDYK